ncbi:hypothetical protein ACV56Z_07165 [Staphylococcus aureus]
MLNVSSELDIPANTEPIRGGTDGSQLSFMGLPTPNIFTGCGNFHGPYEYASIDVMEKAVQVIIGIVRSLKITKNKRLYTSSTQA